MKKVLKIRGLVFSVPKYQFRGASIQIYDYYDENVEQNAKPSFSSNQVLIQFKAVLNIKLPKFGVKRLEVNFI